MKWSSNYIYIPQYKHTSTNQYGNRYKKVSSKRLDRTCLIAEVGDAADLKRLILLSHHLNTPVRYDFSTEPQTAYIHVVSAEQILKGESHD